ncbi:conserved domain protein (plasmid) [Bacillus anthracis str. A0488]|uniref:Conserved domain protein n=1 Tax=Bacillus anthracis TaxID=1392 RepID=Q6EZV8_BACAN|nr:hypothetical protein BX_A0059 [Bacillus anthracis str. A2012]AAT28800.2 conserved domain protein [Bacillus anthracis str. 'Ames Ancestor']ADK08092.1 hypothetical protein BACI_pCIXO100570 [Bacillus cereus biovar anthracis str. CI]EDR16338.1 conserved domain protein [Bacillus anthracis str. A0488]EDR85303.1 conserved domain protein [Bacillus anthracis str. A0193]EDR90500.1 conserved domain protein [Bacillus anthracis str. A0442]EDS94448.1 conserved domain protein [Bacillus anthracis str. A03
MYKKIYSSIEQKRRFPCESRVPSFFFATDNDALC